MELSILWFFIVGVLLVGYPCARRLRLRCRHVAAVPRQGQHRSARDHQHHRPGLGLERDLADRGRRLGLFAAFPEWYATMFSGFYLALLLILVARILRGVSFEYRHQGKGRKWTRWFDQFIFWGSLIPLLLWGTAFANLIQGVPIRPLETGGWIYEGTLLTLLNPTRCSAASR